MTDKNKPSKTELVYNKLNQMCYQDTDLFSETQMPCYWKLSDLANLYPGLFDVKRIISFNQINNMNSQITSKIPQFKDLFPKPVHIVTTKEPYTIRDVSNNSTKTVKNGINQHMTRVACEYLFKQFSNTEIEQAFFLSPNRTLEDVSNLSQEIRFERIRNQISGLVNTLTSYITQASPQNPYGYREIWEIIWQNFYNTQNTSILKQEYNIKKSPIDYMSYQSLWAVNWMLQTIVSRYQNCPFHNINMLGTIARESAIAARQYIIQRGSTPQQQLTSFNSYNRLVKIQKLREKFWLQYYPETLQK